MLQDLQSAAWRWYSVVSSGVETKPRISRGYHRSIHPHNDESIPNCHMRHHHVWCVHKHRVVRPCGGQLAACVVERRRKLGAAHTHCSSRNKIDAHSGVEAMHRHAAQLRPLGWTCVKWLDLQGDFGGILSTSHSVGLWAQGCNDLRSAARRRRQQHARWR